MTKSYNSKVKNQYEVKEDVNIFGIAFRDCGQFFKCPEW